MTEPNAWHKQSKAKMGKTIGALFGEYEKTAQGRRARYVRNLELFERKKLGGYSAMSYDGADVDSWDISVDRLGLVRAAVEHAVADIYAPQKPKPQFQTVGATWRLKRKAQILDRIVEGLLHQRIGTSINVWAFMVEAATDAVIQGDCFVKLIANSVAKRIEHKAIPCVDIFCDPAEGKYPMNWFQREAIDEETAIARWPKFADDIRKSKDFEWYMTRGTMRMRASRVKSLKYAYRLPDGPEEKHAGRCAMVLGDKVIEIDPWTAPAPPWVRIQWEPSRQSPWGLGIPDAGRHLAEDAGDYDYRLLQRGILGSGQYVFVPRGASVKQDDLALNDPKVIIPYDGPNPPSVTQLMPFSEAEWRFREAKVDAFWDAVGLSRISAAARREAAINSGRGQLTVSQLKQGRQLRRAQNFENAFIDLAQQYIYRLRELAEDDPNFMVRWPGRTLIREYKFSEADIDDDLFTVVVAPSSQMARDPFGRQEQVQMMIGSGLVSIETGRQLMQLPDIDAELDKQNAEGEYIDMLIDRYLDAEKDSWDMGDFESPEGFIFNKVGALRSFSSAWFRARIDQSTLPEDEQRKAEFNISLLERYIKELNVLIAPSPPTDQMTAPQATAAQTAPAPAAAPLSAAPAAA